MAVTRRGARLSNGHANGFEPLVSLDLSKVKTVSDLVGQMGRTAFGGRCVGEAADILQKMAEDKGCFVVLTLSGAMTIAKMGLVICDMIDHELANAVVSTGALMAHGIVEASGLSHFKYREGMNDTELFSKGYNRVYDTIELEKNLDGVELLVKNVLDELDREKPIASHILHERIGEHLAQNAEGRGILKSAFLKKVPVYVPAFTDSEMGLDVALFNRMAKINGEKPFVYNPFLDLEHFTEKVVSAERIGIFTVGGGVPRNWAQQVGPYLDIIAKRLKAGMPQKRYTYGVRICPEPVHWGGLSGCTYSEGISWGKFIPRSEGGMWAEVYADATIALPLIVKAVLERLGTSN